MGIIQYRISALVNNKQSVKDILFFQNRAIPRKRLRILQLLESLKRLEPGSFSSLEYLELGDLRSGPTSPVLNQYPLSDFSGTSGFAASYFKTFEWLEYSMNKYVVFCYLCIPLPFNNI